MKFNKLYKTIKFSDGYLIVNIAEKNYGKDKYVLYINESAYHIIELLSKYHYKKVVELLSLEDDNSFSKEELDENVRYIISTLINKGIIEVDYMDHNSIDTLEIIGFGPIKNKLAMQRRPLVGVVEITPKCNCNCPHCYVKGFSSENWLSTEKFIEISEIFSENGILNVTLTGGEPLSHPDFKEIYKAFKEKGFLIDLFSNGLLIDEDFADFLAKLPPRSIDITLYGLSDEEYYKFTGVKDGFTRLCRALDLLTSRGVYFTTKMILHQGNICQLDSFNRFALKYNAPFRYNVIIGEGNNILSDPNEIALTPEQIIAIEKNDPLRIAIFNTLAKKCSNLPLDCSGCNWSQFPCGAGLEKVFIGFDGKMSPCMTLRDKGQNIFVHGFTKVWEYWGAERKKTLSEDCECISCEYMPICTPCTAEFRKTNGNNSHPIKERCELAKLRWNILVNER